MTKTKLLLATDATIRADQFRVELIGVLQKKDSSPEELYSLISRSYALLGNLQRHVGEYCQEMNNLNHQNILPD